MSESASYLTITKPDKYTLDCVERVLNLAERMSKQDRQLMSQGQITLEMVRDVAFDEEAINEVSNFFLALSETQGSA